MKISRREWLRFCVGSVASVSLEAPGRPGIAESGIRVIGTSRRDRVLTLSMLNTLPLRSSTTRKASGTGSRMSPVVWQGCSLSDLIDAESLREAAWCSAIGSDGYTIPYRIETILAPGVVLAWFMNGTELPFELGAPFRLIIPSLTPKRRPKAVAELRFYGDFPAEMRFARPPQAYTLSAR